MNLVTSEQLGSPGSGADPAPRLPPARGRRALSAAWSLVSLAVPLLAWEALAWHRRWIADDGLIAIRTVREILAGNGPVFNAGERVEANTSALWTWLLALFTWVSRLNVDTVVIGTGLVLAPLGLLFAMLGARDMHRRLMPGRPLLPVGAAVVVALPPFWDFATSGLEDSLVFCWLGLCWWLLAGLRPDSRRRAGWLAFTAGLGWLVRPDMAIGTVGFLAALWYITRPGWRRLTALAAIAGALPVAYQVFRMGYYGLLVPNTAVAKEASDTRLPQGLGYLANFAGTYWLWIPLLLLIAAFALITVRGLDRHDVARVVAAAGSGVVMAAYVIAIGGDFMHARMLLPATFAILLPLMMLPVPKLRGRAATAAVSWLCVAATGVWVLACGASLRMPQAGLHIPRDGIVNERAYYVIQTRQPYPDTEAKYVRGIDAPLAALITRDAGQRVLLYQLGEEASPFFSVPLAPGSRYAIAATARTLGARGAALPLDGLVLDVHGLSYALGSHVTGDPAGRPGHNKLVPPAWMIAEYSEATSASGIDPAQIAAARKALSCGPLAQLDRATQASLTAGQFMSNFVHSLSLTTFRFSADPVAAEKQLCG